ncbi:hypothetical protein DIPPA_09700 [Diplonema papillatum]|nr:hypothetical protein DIPPA_09700 [Diplonema papillatum]
MVAIDYRPSSVSHEALRETQELVSHSQGPRAPRPASPVPTGNVTVDVLLKLIARNPGSSVGGYNVLRKVWVAVGAHISETLCKGRGVCIPGFAAFSVQKSQLDRGTWGEKLRLVPSFVLLPSFCQNFSVRSPHSVKASHFSSAATPPLNVVNISIKAGVTKDVASSAIKDVWRKVGEVAARGATFHIDFGCAKVCFQGNLCEVHWNASLLASLDKLCNKTNCRALRSAANHVENSLSVKSVPSRQYESSSLLPSDVQLQRGEEFGTAYTGLASPAASRRRPGAARHQGEAARRHRQPARGGHAAHWEQGREGPVAGNNRDADPALESYTVDRAADVKAMSSVRSHLHDALQQSQDFDDDHADDERPNTAGVSLMSPGAQTTTSAYNEKWVSRLRNKAVYKRLRNKAYAAAWEDQRHAKAVIESKERDRDRQRMERVQSRSRAEDEALDREEEERRKIAKSVQQANLHASAPRKRRAIPEGELYYWGNEETRTESVNLAREMRLLDEKQQKKAAEKEANDRAEREALEERRRAWEAEEQEDRERQRVRQAQMRGVYHEHLRKKNEKPKEESIGNFFFKSATPQDMLADEKLERRLQREAALEVQRENLKTVERMAEHKKMAAGLSQLAERRHQGKSMEKSFSQLDKTDDEKKAEAALMRKAWDAQMDERRRMRQKEDAERKKTRILHCWRNESSDEEYDDVPASVRRPLSSRHSHSLAQSPQRAHP